MELIIETYKGYKIWRTDRKRRPYGCQVPHREWAEAGSKAQCHSVEAARHIIDRMLAYGKGALISPRFAACYLQQAKHMPVTDRTVRNWLNDGLLDGELIVEAGGMTWWTTEALIDEALEGGLIPPPRGRPKGRRGDEPI